MARLRTLLRAGFVVLVPALLAACSSGGVNTPGLTTGITPPGGQLSVSPSSVTFSGLGSAYTRTVNITTTVPTSVITATPSAACGTGSSALVVLSNFNQINGASFTVTATPQNAGTCTITLTSGSGGSATLTVIVNNGSVTISSRNGQ
jgi:hypothetical protein